MPSEKRPELGDASQSKLQTDTPQPEKVTLVNPVPADLPQVPDQYELLELLGDGGMGVVYKAQQRFTRQVVAIKILKDKAASDVALQRFQREALAACAFTHPNAVRVLDFGVTNESPYLVMEYVQGETLDARLKRGGALSPDNALPLFLSVTDVLAEAHRAGVVHRDLKPANIIIQKIDSSEVAKVLDFGIAKIIDRELHTLTKTGDVFGTPLYMSPEQLKGNSVDCRSDVYSLGAVMYECLAGEPPHKGDSAYAIMYKRLGDPPSSFKQLSKSVPKDLEGIIFKCLELAPAKRYASATELGNDLRRFRKSRGPSSRLNPFAFLRNFTDNGASYKRPALFALTAVALVVALMAGKTLINNFQDSERYSSVRAFKEKADTYLANRQYDDALSNYSEAWKIVDSDDRPGTTNLKVSLLSGLIACLVEEHSDYFAEMRYLNNYLSIAKDRENTSARMSVQNVEEYEEHRLEIANVLKKEAEQGVAAGKRQDALRCYAAIESMLDAAPKRETKLKVQECMNNYADLLALIGNEKQAIRKAELSIALCQELGLTNERGVAHLHLVQILGQVHPHKQ